MAESNRMEKKNEYTPAEAAKLVLDAVKARAGEALAKASAPKALEPATKAGEASDKPVDPATSGATIDTVEALAESAAHLFHMGEDEAADAAATLCKSEAAELGIDAELFLEAAFEADEELLKATPGAKREGWYEHKVSGESKYYDGGKHAGSVLDTPDGFHAYTPDSDDPIGGGPHRNRVEAKYALENHLSASVPSVEDDYPDRPRHPSPWSAETDRGEHAKWRQDVQAYDAKHGVVIGRSPKVNKSERKLPKNASVDATDVISGAPVDSASVGVLPGDKDSKPSNPDRQKEPKVVKGKAVKKDEIPGGLADGAKDAEFDPEQLAAGVKVEMEHTDDEKVAREIAQDHLKEDRDYYKKLAGMEKEEIPGGAGKKKPWDGMSDAELVADFRHTAQAAHVGGYQQSLDNQLGRKIKRAAQKVGGAVMGVLKPQAGKQVKKAEERREEKPKSIHEKEKGGWKNVPHETMTGVFRALDSTREAEEERDIPSVPGVGKAEASKPANPSEHKPERNSTHSSPPRKNPLAPPAKPPASPPPVHKPERNPIHQAPKQKTPPRFEKEEVNEKLAKPVKPQGAEWSWQPPEPGLDVEGLAREHTGYAHSKQGDSHHILRVNPDEGMYNVSHSVAGPKGDEKVQYQSSPFKTPQEAHAHLRQYAGIKE